MPEETELGQCPLCGGQLVTEALNAQVVVISCELCGWVGEEVKYLSEAWWAAQEAED